MENTDWVDVIVLVGQADKEAAAAVTTMVSGSGIYIEDYSDLEEKVLEIAHVDLIEEELRNQPKNTAKIHMYIPGEENTAEIVEIIRGKLLAAGIDHSLSTEGLRQEDWENSWKQYYHAQEIGERLAVVPSWEEYQGRGRAILRLDPGMAFGTGTHETTRLCLEFLERHLRGGETVLDVGCGSGILAVAALLLGAKKACGIDIDPVAVRVAAENAERNGVQGRLQLLVGNLAEKISDKYDVICANIVASAIVQLCPAIPPLLATEGRFIASGIIDTRAEEVKAALVNCGLMIEKTEENNGWVAIVCKNRESCF